MNASLAFIPGMSGAPEIVIIVLIVLLLFGGKKIPELARSLGKSLGEFKKGQQEGNLPDTPESTSEKKEIIDEEDTKTESKG